MGRSRPWPQPPVLHLYLGGNRNAIQTFTAREARIKSLLLERRKGRPTQLAGGMGP